MKSIYFFAAVLLLPFDQLTAQTKDTEKYRKESEIIRKQVWDWDKAQFKNREVPAEYNSVSKVILAHHTELTADSKSKIAFYGFGFGGKKELSITEIVREMVKLNDKSAVSDYSELSFTQFERSSGFFFIEKSTTTYVGIRVIKSNGQVKEINADDIVLTKDDSKAKKAKVAVPDLQPGDILDYFIATEQFMTNDISNKYYNLLLFNGAPMLHYSFHAQLGKKYAIEYRSYNNAPQLKVTKNEEKDIIIDVEEKNIPPFETSLWVAPARQLPFVRMNISLGYSGLGSKYLDTKKPGEVTKVTNNQEILEDLANGFSSTYHSGYWMKQAKAQYDQVESEAKKKAKQSGISFSDLNNTEKAAFLYYTFRFMHLLEFYIDGMSNLINIGEREFNGLAFQMFATMKAAGLDPAIMISESRTGFRMNEVMNTEDMESTAYLPGVNKFFSVESVFDLPFDVPVKIEGVKNTKSFTFEHPAAVMSMKKMAGLTNTGAGPNVPISSSEKNSRIENLRLSLTADKAKLAVKRTTTLKGYYKRDAQRSLILYEELYEAERKAFKESKSLIEEMESDKRGKKFVEEVKNAFADARKKQKESFKKEAEEWFGQEITELKDHKVENLGIRHTSPDFIYSSSFQMEGLVKKAGNNFILEIGKIQGQPLVLKDEQRKRKIDIYMPFARSIEQQIELEIPEGYVIEGVKELNTKVENETGYFIVEATANEKLVSIKVKKHYLHNFEALDKFEKLMEFMDASNNWLNAKLLLKKQ